MPESKTGTGHLRSGKRDLGVTRYEIHDQMHDRPGPVVELEGPPVAQDGEVLELATDDGRILQIHVRGVSPYCRIIGQRPQHERRRDPQPLPAGTTEGRRRSDARGLVALEHPCPRCTAQSTIVTHRGVTLTTLYCTVCGHGWGESPSAVTVGPRADRRSAVRPDANERRAPSRVATPSCRYCGTDQQVTVVRRSPSEITFVCATCETQWVLPRGSAIEFMS